MAPFACDSSKNQEVEVFIRYLPQVIVTNEKVQQVLALVRRGCESIEILKRTVAQVVLMEFIKRHHNVNDAYVTRLYARIHCPWIKSFLPRSLQSQDLSIWAGQTVVSALPRHGIFSYLVPKSLLPEDHDEEEFKEAEQDIDPIHVKRLRTNGLKTH